jgi:hypothetical protein
MTPTDYTTAEAAQYCGLTLRGFIYHTRRTHKRPAHIIADYRIGRSNIYTRKTLDAFNATRRKAGRPRKTTAHDAQGARDEKSKA